jgi:stage II sporulation protein D
MKFISNEDLKSDLLEDTGDIGDIVDFSVVKKGVSGRIITCQVKGTTKTVTLDGDEVQWDIGLNSTWFDLVFIPGGVVACGRGWGHGLGMSQYGSKAMAVAGKKYVEIVKHYYTGVQVMKWY